MCLIVRVCDVYLWQVLCASGAVPRYTLCDVQAYTLLCITDTSLTTLYILYTT